MTSDKGPSPLSLFEFWPGGIFYTPIVLYWILMGLRYRDLSLPTAANPRVETGGLCGESKSSILDMAGSEARKAIAPYALFASGERAATGALAAMERAGIGFPVVVKPDVGCNGTGVRLVTRREDLDATLALFPGGVTLMVQELIGLPVEAGLFYVRHPGESCGRITSLTYKEAPVVTGDGRSTVEELILADERMGRIPHLYLPRLAGRERTVPAKGETFPLLFAGNHCKGAVFRDARADITPELTARIDAILRDVPDFHFGRVDLKVPSAGALRRGEGLRIIEINGIGSEAIHIWDRRTTLREAYAAQFAHYRDAFRIGAANRARGWKTSGAFTMLWAWRRQKRLLASYPMND